MLKRWAALWLCLLLFAPLCGMAAEQGGNLRVVFLNCGKGDSALVQIGECAMLIDTGHNADGSAIVAKLRALGVARLDVLVITHPHKDHVGGADRVLEAMEVGQVLEGPLSGDSNQEAQFREVLEAQGKTATLLRAGDTFSLGGAEILCLGPLQALAEEENDLSLVLRMDYGETSFLFTGDAERSALEDLMAVYQQNGLLAADVLKVPHHGRKERNSALFFQLVSPKIAFIPCARDTEDQLPDQEVLDALEALSTYIYIADDGDVAVYSDGARVWAEQNIFATDP